MAKISAVLLLALVALSGLAAGNVLLQRHILIAMAHAGLHRLVLPPQSRCCHVIDAHACLDLPPSSATCQRDFPAPPAPPRSPRPSPCYMDPLSTSPGPTYTHPAPHAHYPCCPAAHARGVQTGTGCPFWRPLVQCLVDPCTVTTCLVNTTCESNYCGGCNARCVPIVAPKPRFNLRDKLCSLIGGIWCARAWQLVPSCLLRGCTARVLAC